MTQMNYYLTPMELCKQQNYTVLHGKQSFVAIYYQLHSLLFHYHFYVQYCHMYMYATYNNLCIA